MEEPMLRILIIALILLLPIGSAPALSRVIETASAAAQRDTAAVVNMSVWKLRKAPGEAPRRVKANGSGFVIDPSGIIVTNKHVIDGALDIKVIFDNGDRLTAKLLAVAAMVDLAVVKVDAGRPLPALQWGDSDALRVGDPVLTIGNPLGLGISVSAGIVSALNRDLQDTPFDNYIQTDAAINHGNSGGPLVDANGAVVGIDTALLNPEESGGFIGIGLAIPANAAKFVVELLLDPSHPKPGWLGVTLQDLTPDLSAGLRLRDAKGAVIAALDTDGPASRASLRPGDVLTAVDGIRLNDSRAFMRQIAMLRTGKPAELTIWRGGREQTVTATVEEWPNYMPGGGIISADKAAAMIQQMPDTGVRLAELTDETRKQYGIDPNLTGALVASVEKDSEAGDLGVAAGDVITAVQDGSVTAPEDVRRAMQAAHAEHQPYLAVLVHSKSRTFWVPFSIDGAGS
jgi:serine protease Do